MLNLSLNKTHRSVGIDIGTSSIKVVEIEQNKKKQIVNYGYFYNKKDDSFYYNSFRSNYGVVVDILRRIYQEARIAGKDAYMSIPVHLSFFTILSLPKMKKEEMARSIQFEAKKFIPVPIDEVHFDWSVLKHLSKGNDQKVLILAVPNDIVLRYYAIAKSLGLALKGIEIESFSLSRALIGDDGKPTMVLDIGTRVASILVVEKHCLSMQYHSNVSMMRLIQYLAKGMNISYERALQFQRTEGAMTQKNIYLLVQSIIDELLSEMKKVNEDYIHQGGSAIERVVVSGGVKDMPGFLEHLSKTFEVPVVGADLKDNHDLELPSQFQDKSFIDLSIAAGLAMR